MTPREVRLAKKERERRAWLQRRDGRIERFKRAWGGQKQEPLPEGVFHVPMPRSFDLESGFSFSAPTKRMTGKDFAALVAEREASNE